jgi:hypothetical protein
MAYDFQNKNDKIRLLIEYESVTKKDLSGNNVLPALMSGSHTSKW